VTKEKAIPRVRGVYEPSDFLAGNIELPF